MNDGKQRGIEEAVVDGAYLEAIVGVMRAHGVREFGGVVLDPAFRPPPKNPFEGMTAEETAKAKREGRIAAARQEVRDKLGDYSSSDEFIDQYIEPSVLE